MDGNGLGRMRRVGAVNWEDMNWLLPDFGLLRTVLQLGLLPEGGR